MYVQVAFRRLFYGLMLVLFDFRIQSLDILPDFIGYGLVVSALAKLSEIHLHFNKARIFAIFLLLTSFLDLFADPSTNMSSLVPSDTTVQPMIFSAIAGIFRMFMIYYLCEGIRESALPNYESLAASAKLSKNVFLVVNYLWLFLMPFSLNVSRQIFSLEMLLLIPVFIAEIMLIGLVHRAGRELERGFESTSDY
ncbi:MAG: hypothetical protein M0T74_15640 [Desulfitobacterium hafniense]|nr:hypothetical protein [Desulfitobacterium hafniense]